ncbi:helix-turn-helix domain-containing protein [Dictyobacter vulcani]|uniref:helix-turn-helix domain-containing protein n=1 Tax=Dictyobacter vulcani TaxID=2607529 RepID=UPI00125053E8
MDSKQTLSTLQCKFHIFPWCSFTKNTIWCLVGATGVTFAPSSPTGSQASIWIMHIALMYCWGLLMYSFLINDRNYNAYHFSTCIVVIVIVIYASCRGGKYAAIVSRIKRIKLRLRECLNQRGMTMTTLSHRTEISYKTIQKLVHDLYAVWGKERYSRAHYEHPGSLSKRDNGDGGRVEFARKTSG